MQAKARQFRFQLPQHDLRHSIERNPARIGLQKVLPRMHLLQ